MVETSGKKEIQSWISRLRIAATLAVVLIHTCSTLVDNEELFEFTIGEALYMNTLHRLCMWSVPVFFMITGALLLRTEKRIPYSICLKKYTARIVICLLLFGSVMGAMKLIGSGTTGAKLLILNVLYSVISGDSFDHLWYLYALIGIYLILPILKAFVDSDTNGRGLACALVLLLIFDFIFPLIEGLVKIKIEFYIPMAYTVFYLLLGHFLMTHDQIDAKIDVAVILFVAVLFVTTERYGIGGSIAAYSSPLTAVMSATIFDLFRHVRDCRKVGTLWKIDRLCFGVYLIHPVFIHLSYRLLRLTPVSFGGLYPLATFGFCLAFCLCSFVGAWVMTWIPLLRQLIN